MDSIHYNLIVLFWESEKHPTELDRSRNSWWFEPPKIDDFQMTVKRHAPDKGVWLAAQVVELRTVCGGSFTNFKKSKLAIDAFGD